MAAMQYETRAKLQQRITQRLKGEFSLASNKHVPPTYVARSRRQMTLLRQQEQDRADPFRMQAQKYYEGRADAEKHIGEAPGEFQLPVLRPRYLDMNGHTTKGIPNQTYVDLILDRKGPWQSLPVANKKLKIGRKYDDSMIIRSYRNDEDVQARKERNHPPQNEIGFSRIMLIAPQKIQYSTSRNFNAGKVYTMDKATSPIKSHNEGAKLKINVESDSSDEFFMKNNNTLSTQRHRKKLTSEDRRFLKEIKKRNKRKREGVVPNEAVFGKAALPPIRITVTNPLPSPVPTVPMEHTDPIEKENKEISSSDYDMFLQVPKNDVTRKKKRKKLEKVKILESFDNERKEMLEPEPNYMPAPVTKITFETFNPINVKPKQNVQVEQIIHGHISATKPMVEAPKPVHMATMDMGGYQGEMVHRKDGSIGPIPPSTNYINFQRTTRLGGQSRVLMAMRRQANEQNYYENYHRNNLDITNSNSYYLTTDRGSDDAQQSVEIRKLGKIKVEKTSALVKAHNKIMGGEDARVEVGSSSDDDSFMSIRQRRTRKPGNLVTTATQVPAFIPNTRRNEPAIQGFYMGSNLDTANREFILQQIENSDAEDLLAPPNTAYNDSRPP